MKEICGHTFYTTGETAILLGITGRTIQRWFTSEDNSVRRGKAPNLNIVTELNGRHLFRSEEIHALVEKTYGIKIDVTAAKKMIEESRAKR